MGNKPLKDEEEKELNNSAVAPEAQRIDFAAGIRTMRLVNN